MLADQVVQTLIEWCQQKHALRRVNSECGNAGMQGRRKRNGQRRLESVKKAGIKNLRRRGGHDDSIPLSIGYELFDPLDDDFFFVGDLIERFAVELQAHEIHFDRARDQRQKAVVMRHRAGAAANESYCCLDYFSHGKPPADRVDNPDPLARSRARVRVDRM